MLKLYGRPGSGSSVCEAMLALTGAPHEVVDLMKLPDGTLPETARAVNPLGEVPALALGDGTVMTESAAICLFLADAFPAAQLAPAIGDPARPAYLRWMIFLAANVYMTDLRCFYPHRYTTDADGAEGVKAAALARKAVEWRVFADALGEKDFILGARISVADIYAAMFVSWIEPLAAFFATHSNLEAHYAHVASVPEIRAVWQRHGMPV